MKTYLVACNISWRFLTKTRPHITTVCLKRREPIHTQAATQIDLHGMDIESKGHLLLKQII